LTLAGSFEAVLLTLGLFLSRLSHAFENIGKIFSLRRLYELALRSS
jgi:hypothetical protein